MSLTPEIEPVIDDEDLEVFGPSKTFKMDLETGKITRTKIDGLEAIKQFIYIALRIPRFAHAIYSADTGCELDELIADQSASYALKEMEIPRLIEEALIYDDRIESVGSFDVKRVGESVHVSFVVSTIAGSLEIREEVGPSV